MKLTMKQDEYFCLRNWALYRGSLRILLTVLYADGHAGKPVLLDLWQVGTVPEGILLLCHPETGGTGLLCLTVAPGQHTVIGCRLHFESIGRPLSALHLEYAAADAMTAYAYREIPWEASALTQPDLLLMRRGSTVTVTAPQERGEVRPAAAAWDTEDIRDDIEADLRILRCYSGSDAARLAAALSELLRRLPELRPSQAAQELSAQEAILTRLIDRTQEEIHRCQAQLYDSRR